MVKIKKQKNWQIDVQSTSICQVHLDYLTSSTYLFGTIIFTFSSFPVFVLRYAHPDAYVQSLTSALVSIRILFALFSLLPPPSVF